MTLIEHLEVISNIHDANHVYYSILQGTRLRSSASIQEDSKARKLEILMCTNFSCVITGGVCQRASERKCSTLHEEDGLTDSQVA